MRNLIVRLKLKLESALKYSFVFRKVYRVMLTSLGTLSVFKPVKRRAFLLKALQMVNRPGEEINLIKALELNIEEERISLKEVQSFYNQVSSDVSKAVIIKPYISPNEKGVIFISFEKMLARLMNGKNLNTFFKEYNIVFAPSWSPPFSLGLLAVSTFTNDPVISLISNKKDLLFLKSFGRNILPIELYASSWVDPNRFYSTPIVEKDIDLLIIACFSKVKRHFALFKALQKLKNKNYRVCLIGHDEPGRDLGVMRAEARLYGVENQVEFIGGVPYEEIPRYLSRAKASATFSKREGSCVIVVESMLANTPVGLYSDAEIGSKAFINDQTGLLFNDTSLAEDLSSLIENSGSYNPRKWVMDKDIHYMGSHAILNEELKNKSKLKGHKWTKDIYKMKWSPNPVLIEYDDEIIQFEQQRIFERYELSIGSKDQI